MHSRPRYPPPCQPPPLPSERPFPPAPICLQCPSAAGLSRTVSSAGRGRGRRWSTAPPAGASAEGLPALPLSRRLQLSRGASQWKPLSFRLPQDGSPSSLPLPLPLRSPSPSLRRDFASPSPLRSYLRACPLPYLPPCSPGHFRGSLPSPFLSLRSPPIPPVPPLQGPVKPLVGLPCHRFRLPPPPFPRPTPSAAHALSPCSGRLIFPWLFVIRRPSF